MKKSEITTANINAEAAEGPYIDLASALAVVPTPTQKEDVTTATATSATKGTTKSTEPVYVELASTSAVVPTPTKVVKKTVTPVVVKAEEVAEEATTATATSATKATTKSTEPVYVELASTSAVVPTPAKVVKKTVTPVVVKAEEVAEEATTATTTSATKATTKSTEPVYVELAVTPSEVSAKVVKKTVTPVVVKAEEVAEEATTATAASATKGTTKSTDAEKKVIAEGDFNDLGTTGMTTLQIIEEDPLAKKIEEDPIFSQLAEEELVEFDSTASAAIDSTKISSQKPVYINLISTAGIKSKDAAVKVVALAPPMPEFIDLAPESKQKAETTIEPPFPSGLSDLKTLPAEESNNLMNDVTDPAAARGGGKGKHNKGKRPHLRG